ncbi:hypothetical protein EB74_16875 [Mycobacterium sp. SWH-M5]|nr:hypothetical protein EB74_16875 [Mycobacterium sp. SWH-M5]
MGALDGFYSTWNKARETFGQGVPTDGSQFDQSRSLTQMKASVEAAAPDDRWQGSGANAYAAANKDHAQVYQKLADLDQKMAAEVKNAANVVSVGRTNLDNAKGWVESMANSLPATSAQDRERKLIPIAREGINRVDNIVKTATSEMMGIKGRVTGFKTEYDTIKNSVKFASGAKEGGLPDIFKPEEEKKDEEKKKPELNSKNGKDDGAVLRDGLVRAMLPSDYHDRLIEASTLTPEQLADLAAGKDVVVGADRMAYLYQLSQAFNGMTPEEIKAATAELPPDERKALAQGLAIVSNDNALSGIANTEGVTDATRDNFIPAAGSLANLPDGMYNELTRNDRVVYDTPSYPNAPTEMRMNGVGAMQDIADIMKPAAPGYLNGSEATRSMLDAASQYSAADLKAHDTGGIIANTDAHGPLKNALADVISVAGHDHVDVHDIVTGPYGNNFMDSLMNQDWGDQSSKIGTAFNWMDDDPNNHINSATGNKIGHYIADRAEELRSAKGGIWYGHPWAESNPGLAQAMAEGISPYLTEFAGGGPSMNLEHPGVEAFANGRKFQDLFSVFDLSPESAITLNEAARSQYSDIIMAATDADGINGNQLEIAGRLQNAMVDGAGIAESVEQSDDFGLFKNALSLTLANVPYAGEALALADIWHDIQKEHAIPPYVYTAEDASKGTGTLAFQTDILNGLLANHPEIAQTPELVPYINNGHVEIGETAKTMAGSVFAEWFREVGPNYGVEFTKWTEERSLGNNDDW